MKSISSGSDMQYNHISAITLFPAQPARNSLLMLLKQSQEYHKNNFKSVLLFSRLLLALTLFLSLSLSLGTMCA